LTLLTLRKVWLKALQATTTFGTAALLFPTLDGAPLRLGDLGCELEAGGRRCHWKCCSARFGAYCFPASTCGATNTDSQQPGAAVSTVEPTRDDE